MVATLRTRILPKSSRILSEDLEVTRYELSDVSAPWQWTGMDYFEWRHRAGRC